MGQRVDQWQIHVVNHVDQGVFVDGVVGEEDLVSHQRDDAGCGTHGDFGGTDLAAVAGRRERVVDRPSGQFRELGDDGVEQLGIGFAIRLRYVPMPMSSNRIRTPLSIANMSPRSVRVATGPDAVCSTISASTTMCARDRYLRYRTGLLVLARRATPSNVTPG